MLFVFVSWWVPLSQVPGIPGSKEQSMSHSHFLSPRTRFCSVLVIKFWWSQIASWCLSLKATCEPVHIPLRTETSLHLIRPPGCRVRHARSPGVLRARSWHCTVSWLRATQELRVRTQREIRHVYTRAVSSEWLSVSRRQLTNTVLFAATLADSSPLAPVVKQVIAKVNQMSVKT